MLMALKGRYAFARGLLTTVREAAATLVPIASLNMEIEQSTAQTAAENRQNRASQLQLRKPLLLQLMGAGEMESDTGSHHSHHSAHSTHSTHSTHATACDVGDVWLNLAHVLVELGQFISAIKLVWDSFHCFWPLALLTVSPLAFCYSTLGALIVFIAIEMLVSCCFSPEHIIRTASFKRASRHF